MRYATEAVKAELKEQIRAARRARGWTQAELAARIGVSLATVSRWERGSRPRRAHLQAMAEVLRASSLGAALPDPIGDRRRTRLALAATRIAVALQNLVRPA